MKGKAQFLKLETPCYIIYHMLGDNRIHTLDFKLNLEDSIGPYLTLCFMSFSNPHDVQLKAWKYCLDYSRFSTNFRSVNC